MWTQLKPETTLVRMSKGGCRSISNTVLFDVLTVPQPTLEECDEWSHLIGVCGVSEPGHIANLGESTTLVTPVLQAAIDEWLVRKGLREVNRKQAALPLACIGAGFHHDALSYDDEVFCVLWLSDDAQWDLYFPHVDVRVPLVYGTIVLFDSAQPHGVVSRGSKTFDPDTLEYAMGTFISQDIIVGRKIRERMGIQMYSRYGRNGFAQLNREGYREELDEETGSWNMRKL